MPFCGFNDKMLKGLTAFSEGLFEHGLDYRSELNGETIDQAIKRELSDMFRLLNEVENISDSSKKLMIEGIIKYAMAFYLHIRHNGRDKAYDTTQDVCNFFKEMDDKFYSELEGKPNDMELLISHLNKIDLKTKSSS